MKGELHKNSVNYVVKSQNYVVENFMVSLNKSSFYFDLQHLLIKTASSDKTVLSALEVGRYHVILIRE